MNKSNIIVIMIVVANLFSGCRNVHHEVGLPRGFWPEVKKVDVGCADLSGKYIVEGPAENMVTAWTGQAFVWFPPGKSVHPGTEFTVKQDGCKEIAISIVDRFKFERTVRLTESRHELRWDNEMQMFHYSPKEIEADGFSGETLFRNASATLGQGIDGSLLCEFKEHSKSKVFFVIRTDYKNHFYFRFKKKAV